MDRSFRPSSKEHAFRNAVALEVDETGYGLAEDRLYLPILYVYVDPIYAVPCRAVISNVVRGLKRNVSDATVLATQSSLTTVSFCRKRKK